MMKVFSCPLGVVNLVFNNSFYYTKICIGLILGLILFGWNFRSSCKMCTLKNAVLCLLSVLLLLADVASDWLNGLQMAGIWDGLTILTTYLSGLVDTTLSNIEAKIIQSNNNITSTEDYFLTNVTTINPHHIICSQDLIYYFTYTSTNFTNHQQINTTHSLELETTHNITLSDSEHDVIWGWMTISLTLLPGFVAGVIMAVVFAEKDNVKLSIIGFFIILVFIAFYPLICIGFIIYSHVSSDQENKRTALQLIANEAFFEAALQFLLQIFIIGSGREPTTITVVSIIISYVTLSKKVPDWDLANALIHTEGFLNNILSILTNTTLYALSIISRLGSLAVIIILFRYWAIIPIIIIITSLFFIYLPDIRLYKDENEGEFYVPAPVRSLTHACMNTCVMTVYTLSIDIISPCLLLSSVVIHIFYSTLMITFSLLFIYVPGKEIYNHNLISNKMKNATYAFFPHTSFFQ